MGNEQSRGSYAKVGDLVIDCDEFCPPSNVNGKFTVQSCMDEEENTDGEMPSNDAKLDDEITDKKVIFSTIEKCRLDLSDGLRSTNNSEPQLNRTAASIIKLKSGVIDKLQTGLQSEYKTVPRADQKGTTICVN